ncbi:MAG: hypothetical protein GY730_02885 [bacterium]|nr:hypothetical protein [bacterium]
MIKKLLATITVYGLILILSGCKTSKWDSYLKIANEADWSKKEEIEISVFDSEITPEFTVLKKGRNYVLEIKNFSSDHKTLLSSRFWNSIATYKLSTGTGDLRNPLFTTVTVYPNRHIKIYIIPVEIGTYELKVSDKAICRIRVEN